MHRRALVAALALTIAGGAFSAAVGQPAGPSKDPAAAPAGEYVMDPNHTSLIARVRHMGLSNFTIRFDGVHGSFSYDPKNPTATKVQATVDAASFDVGTQKLNADMTLNEHFIKQRDILGNSKNPTVTFASTSIRRTGQDTAVMDGDLTMNGITKPVSLNVTFNGTAPGMGGGGQRMGFSADGVIKRTDFQVLKIMPVPMIGDDVTIHIETEFAKK
jgi:polyisoprenoid-binding protein YceI